MRYNIKAVAEMAERLNAHDSKSCDAGMYPRVQIPLSAPQKGIYHQVYPFLFDSNVNERDLRVGAILRKQNALPYEAWPKNNTLAKDDVNNIGAGRAAKGENPSLCAK